MPVAADPSLAPEPFWGPPTGNIDFCEEAYQVSLYINEFWNTVSNLGYIALAAYGIICTSRLGLERRFYLCHLALMLVGFGSSAFHATLRTQEQMYDEVPMILGSAFILYSILSMKTPRGQTNWGYIVILTAVCSGLMVNYFMVDNAIVFQVSYGALVVLIQVLGMRTIMYLEDVTGNPEAAAHFEKCKDAAKSLFIRAIFTYVLGYGLWNIDMNFCDHLIAIREKVGLPFSALFQFHLWWHLLTGLGTYSCTTILQYVRDLALNGSNHQYDIKQFGPGILYLAPRTPQLPPKINGHINGSYAQSNGKAKSH
ncbi:alkaline phytoceramidase [Ramicandelaber brevisporus]|nr:alkaline phytoceramidase [Ramicandelaber brevisporus]